MNLSINSLSSFAKDVKKLYKKYKLIAQDLKVLQTTLQLHPKAGVELSNNCYKIRMANSSTKSGKSGGFRVIYYYIDKQNNLYLMAIYSKTELENISDEKILEILQSNGLR